MCPHLLQIKRLRDIREEYRADLNKLAEVKKDTSALSSRHEALKWEHEVVTQRLMSVESERDKLQTRFNEAIHEVQRRAGLRQLALERDMQVLEQQLNSSHAITDKQAS